jgi:6-phospho-3-hexuloisomerase
MTSETDRALTETADAVRSVSDADLDAVVDEILAARRIACYAGGREGLVMRGLVMRLFHAGLDAHYVGEMTCPAVGPGDLLVLSCGPGRISMVEALAGVSRRDGARMLYIFTGGLDDEAPVFSVERHASVHRRPLRRDQGAPRRLRRRGRGRRGGCEAVGAAHSRGGVRPWA